MNRVQKLRRQIRSAGDDHAAANQVWALTRNEVKDARSELEGVERERRRILVEGTDEELQEIDERLEALRAEVDDLEDLFRGADARRRAAEAEERRRQKAHRTDVPRLLKEAREHFDELPELLEQVQHHRAALASAEAALGRTVERLRSRWKWVKKQRRGHEFPRLSPDLAERLRWVLLQERHAAGRTTSVRLRDGADSQLGLPIQRDTESEPASAAPGGRVGEIESGAREGARS